MAVALHATPAPLEDSLNRITALELEQEILGREKSVGHANEARVTKIVEELAEERERAANLTQRWEKEKSVVDEIPSAYKDIDQVMQHQTDLVDVVHTLKQVICIKG